MAATEQRIRLDHIDRFSELSDDEVAMMAEVGTYVTVPARWGLMGQGTSADKAYLLLSGEVSVRKDGKEIATLGPGDVFGEMGIVARRLRTATVVSKTRLECLHFTRTQVEELETQIPAFRKTLEAATLERLRNSGHVPRLPIEAAEDLGIDPQRLYELFERAILGQRRTLNRVQVAERAGVPLARATALWRALGFPGAESDDHVLFTEADTEALRMVDRLVESGLIDPAVEVPLVRSLGRSFARLAEMEVTELASAALAGSMLTDQARLEELIDSLLPVVEDMHRYVWRRHIADAAGRMLLFPVGNGESPAAVGFADIVGFTRLSRRITTTELNHLIELFESTTASIVVEHGGRVIKAIGDEVLFVADDPAATGRIALGLVDAQQADPDFPEVSIGLAYGDVVNRLGDVYGPVVNIASRLTSLARPGKVLLDRGMHEALKPLQDEFRVRRSRTARVRGYTRLDTYRLKRARSAAS